MFGDTRSFQTLAQLLAAVPPAAPPAEPGEPLSYALWTMSAPSSPDPDPRPRTLIRAYLPDVGCASHHLNATV
jgi:hypothetical protein